MLIEFSLSLLGILVLLLTTEYLWRSKKINVEVSRKIIHIGSGVLIAFWPYFLSWTVIQVASLLLLAVIFVSYRLNLFRSIHAIDRMTVGEILFPIGVGFCALLEPAPWVFTAAILHLTVADGVAALVGKHYGAGNLYSLLGHKKSVAGSLAFFTTSFLILTAATFFVSESNLPHVYGWFLWSALALTAIENISWYGLDDITVPLSVIIILTVLPT